MKKANMEHVPATKTFATPLYVLDPPDPTSSETTTENCQSPRIAPGRAQPKKSTTKWVIMTAMMTLVAFAAGRVQTFEGFEALQLAESELGATAAFQKTKVVTAGARRMICDHPLLSYNVMAAVVLLSSQPTTHARLANLWRAVWEGT
eukprot:6214190-Pleurochrysis_carterae.AAC.1